MYLKSLKINGFKSFAQKVSLDFNSNISGIVGPNGSGKSNVAESFRFVLGEQSLKNMRGKKGEDLIFSGSGGRLNRGSVEIVLDNSKKNLDIDFNEVKLERVVLRDGVNEYYINGSKVRAKDIQNLLAGANIGASGHHIISQGEADKILSINPKERKAVLEEALGLKVFLNKKVEAERKLQKTRENIKEVKYLQREIDPKLRYLQREVEKIEKSKSLTEELKTLYSQFFSLKSGVLIKLSEVTDKINSENLNKEDIENKIKDKKIELDSKTSETATEVNAEKIKEVRNHISENRNRISELDRNIGKIDVILEMEQERKERMDNISEDDSLNEYKTQLEKVSSVIHDIWVSWAKVLLKEENLSQERQDRWSSMFVDYKSLPKESQSKDKDFAEKILDEMGVEKNAEIEKFDDTLMKEKLSEKEDLNREIEGLRQRQVELETQLDELDDIKDNKESVSQKIQIEILELEKELQKYLGEISVLENDKFRLERKISEFDTEETHCRTIFGHEVNSILNSNAQVSGEEEMNLREKISRSRIILENMGVSGGQEIMDQYNHLKEKKAEVEKQVEDLENTFDSLLSLISDLKNEIEKRFQKGLSKINTEFEEFFKTLFSGGKAGLSLIKLPVKENDEKMEEDEFGVEISVKLPNKKISGLGMLSGGERSLTSIALLFAMSSITPPPFIILDETDAALDEANSKRYGDMIEKLAEHSQLILITHNRETMSRAGILYGVTMGGDGVSRVLSVDLEQAVAVAK